MKRHTRLKQAKKLNLSRQDFKGSGHLTSDDPYDLYRVKLRNRSQLSLSLTSKQKHANVDIEIYGLKGSHRAAMKQIGKTEFSELKRKDIRQHLRRLNRRQQKHPGTESLHTELDKGIYYIRVSQDNHPGRYKLALSSQVLQSSPEQGESRGGSDRASTTRNAQNQLPDWFDNNLRTQGL